MKTQSRIQKVFESKKTRLIPYIMIGDPDFETSYQAIKTLVSSGADIIELGMPFTDPVADGPTIQKAAERALQNEIALSDIFALTKRLRDDGIETPFVLMGYANPPYVYGLEKFCHDAVDAGIDASLIVDIPPEEAQDYLHHAKEAGLETVFLSSLTTHAERLQMIDQASTAFVYYVARAGVTGTRSDLPEDLKDNLKRIRSQIQNKLCVGFGISKPEHGEILAPYVDGIVIGSAIVKLFETHQGDALQNAIRDFVVPVRKAINHV